MAMGKRQKQYLSKENPHSGQGGSHQTMTVTFTEGESTNRSEHKLEGKNATAKGQHGLNSAETKLE